MTGNRKVYAADTALRDWTRGRQLMIMCCHRPEQELGKETSIHYGFANKMEGRTHKKLGYVLSPI